MALPLPTLLLFSRICFVSTKPRALEPLCLVNQGRKPAGEIANVELQNYLCLGFFPVHTSMYRPNESSRCVQKGMVHVTENSKVAVWS